MTAFPRGASFDENGKAQIDSNASMVGSARVGGRACGVCGLHDLLGRR